jgi:hypothetical protein
MPATFRFKFVVWNGMLLWLGLFYYGPQWFPIRAPHELAPGAFDHAVPFLPETAWVYQSLFIFLPLTTLAQRDSASLIRFASGFCLLVLAFSTIFWFYPTQIQDHPPLAHVSWAYDHLVTAVDGRRNAFPSLHAALTVYAGSSLIRLQSKNRFARCGAILWILALLLSTLTTKQHILVDLIFGAGAGLFAGAIQTGR